MNPYLLFFLIAFLTFAKPGQLTATSTHTDKDAILTEIEPGIWIHTTFHTYSGQLVPSNGLVIQDEDSLILIDTGWGEAATVRLFDKIKKEIGLPVKQAVITHFHSDRTAGVDILENKSIEVLAQPMTLQLAFENGNPVPDDTLRGLDNPGDFIQMGVVEIFYPGPAHAPDNLMIWIPEKKVLFGGCAVRAMSVNSLGNTSDADLKAWPKSIRRALSRYSEAETVVPGHGEAGSLDLLRHTISLFKK